MLTEYRGADRKRPRFNRRWLIAALIAGLVALLLVLGLSGGSDDEGGDGKATAERGKDDGKGGAGAGGGEGGPEPTEAEEDVPDTVELELAPRSDSEICLVNKGGAVLIDNQVLSPGDDERFEADAFDVSIGFGEVELTINGRRETVRAKSDSPVTYQVTPNGLRQPVPDTDPECP